MTTRRDFLIYSSSLSLAGLSFWRSPKAIWQLIMPTAMAQSQTGPSEFRDLFVRSIGFQDVLTAAQWQAGQAVTLSKTIEPGSHGHTVIIPAEEIAKLSAGQDASFQSQRAQGHEHQVTIRLRDAVPGGNVLPNISTPTPTVPDPNPATNPGTAGVPPTSNPGKTSDNTFAAILGEGREPYLYVEALQPVDSSTIYYCLGDEHSCSRLDWVVMEKTPVIPGRRLYRSRYPIKLKANDIIHVSALDQTGSRKELHAQVSQLGSGLFLMNR